MNDSKQPPSDRRPIAARNLGASQKVAQTLVDLKMTPNFISVLGLVAGGLAGFLIGATSFWPEYYQVFFVCGATLILVRLLANMFDGMVATILSKPNPLGELYNEIPDRITDAAILVGCGYSINSSTEAGYIAAILAIMTAYVRAVGKTAGSNYVFAGPMAKQQRMFICIGVCLVLAFYPLGLVALSPSVSMSQRQSIMIPTLWIIAAGCVVTIIVRLKRIKMNLMAKS